MRDQSKRRALLLAGVTFCLLLPSQEAHCDFWGADVAVLAQILEQTVMELAELKSILSTGDDTLGLLQDINRGINDSLKLSQTLGVRIDPGLYRELQSVDAAVRGIETLYGKPVNSPLALMQTNTDRTVAEAVSFNNDLNDYAKSLDQVGEQIKSFSHEVSPGGAEKLTAESIGVLIHVMNQQLRASGQGLKLQAQAIAVENKKSKDQTAQYLKEGEALGEKMSGLNPTFNVPRFN